MTARPRSGPPFVSRAPPPRAGKRLLVGMGLVAALAALALGWAVFADARSETAPAALAQTPEVLPAIPVESPAAMLPLPAAGSHPSAAQVAAPAGAASDDPIPAAEESPAVLRERARLAELSAQAHDLVAAALEQLHPEALGKCWPDAPGDGPKLDITYVLAFGRGGGETMRSVNVSGGDVPTEIQTCLRDYPVPPFRIPAPNQRIRTEVLVSYP